MVKDAAYIIEEITTILEGTYFVITKKRISAACVYMFQIPRKIFYVVDWNMKYS